MLVRLRGRPSHLRRKELIFLFRVSTVDIVTSYTNRGQRMRGRMPCWYNHTLNLPSNTDLSTADNQASSFLMVTWTDAVSLRIQSKTLQRLMTGFSVIDGIDGITASSTKKRNFFATFPFFRTMF